MCFLIRHVATETTSHLIGRLRIIARSVRTVIEFRARTPDTYSGRGSLGVVVVESSGLQDLHWEVRKIQLELGSSNNGADNQGKEDDKEDKVKDGVADDSSLTKLGLLQRIDRRTDLTAAVR